MHEDARPCFAFYTCTICEVAPQRSGAKGMHMISLKAGNTGSSQVGLPERTQWNCRALSIEATATAMLFMTRAITKVSQNDGSLGPIKPSWLPGLGHNPSLIGSAVPFLTQIAILT